MKRVINYRFFAAAGPAYQAETIAYRDRVELDGGAVMDLAYVDAAYKKLKEQAVAVSYSWLSASFGIKKDAGGYVSKLYSLGGAALDLVQTSGALQPKWVSNGFNNLPELQFDAVDDAMAPATKTNFLQANSIFTVGKSTRKTGSNSAFFFDGTTGTARNALYNAANLSFNFSLFAGATLDGLQSDINTHLFLSKFKGAASELHIDNTLKATGNAGTQGFDYVTLGNAYPGGGLALAGSISEFFFINADISGTEFSTFLNNKYLIY